MIVSGPMSMLSQSLKPFLLVDISYFSNASADVGLSYFIRVLQQVNKCCTIFLNIYFVTNNVSLFYFVKQMTGHVYCV